MLIDKNHPPNSFNKVTKMVDAFQKKLKIPCLKVLLAPLSTPPRVRDSPFSYQLLLSCLHRATLRTDHETLDNSDVNKTLGVVLFFAAMYKKVVFSDANAVKNGFDSLARVIYKQENRDLIVPEEVRAVLDKCTNVKVEGHFPDKLVLELL